jgi:Amt family ammonium transporter
MTMPLQIHAQVLGVVVVALWSALATVVLGLGLARIWPMRVNEDDEREGLDLASHGELKWTDPFHFRATALSPRNNPP